ncbi:MAG: YfiR family protein [Bacteroidales bacterium]|nr:YfiR family protein [Bacteroidales bacterium]
MIKKILLYITIVAAIILPQVSSAQTFDYQNILRFAHYVYWPEPLPQDTFIIYIAAQSPDPLSTISDELKKQKFNGKPIALKTYNDQTSIDDAQVIFIDHSASINNNILEGKLKKMKILTLSNNKNLLNYGCMFFIEQKAASTDYLFKKETIIDSGLMFRATLLSPGHQYIE